MRLSVCLFVCFFVLENFGTSGTETALYGIFCVLVEEEFQKDAFGVEHKIYIQNEHCVVPHEVPSVPKSTRSVRCELFF